MTCDNLNFYLRIVILPKTSCSLYIFIKRLFFFLLGKKNVFLSQLCFWLFRRTKWHLQNGEQMVDESSFIPWFAFWSHSARHKVTLTRIKWGILIWSKGPFTESTPLPSDQRLQNVKVLLLSGRDGRMGATCDQSKPTTTATGRGGLTRRDTYTWM